MVAYRTVQSANAELGIKDHALTAVFVGATSGIGLATLKALVKRVPRPTAIIVGRSQTKFEPELDHLKQLCPKGEFTFIEADISLMNNIDGVCDIIKQKLNGRQIDMLFTSQGYISFNGRENNADGLDNSISLRYYGRIRFAQKLLPVLAKHGWVMSVLAGGKEGKIIEDDLDLERNYSIPVSAAQFATMTTLSFDHLGQYHPDKSFIHVYPGLVSTGLLGRSATGALGMIFRYVLEPVLGLFSLKPEEVGERMLYYGMHSGSVKGSLSLDWDGTEKETQELKGYREKGWAERVWEHNQRMFETALSQ